MKRTLTAAAGGFILGYAYAFVSWLVGGKALGSLRKQPPHPTGPCAEDCPWTEHPGPTLNGDDMHDVLPTDDELYPEVSGTGVPYPSTRYATCSECRREVPLPWRGGYLSTSASFMADLCSTCGYRLSS